MPTKTGTASDGSGPESDTKPPNAAKWISGPNGERRWQGRGVIRRPASLGGPENTGWLVRPAGDASAHELAHQARAAVTGGMETLRDLSANIAKRV